MFVGSWKFSRPVSSRAEDPEPGLPGVKATDPHGICYLSFALVGYSPGRGSEEIPA